jgi:hypothetical protein
LSFLAVHFLFSPDCAEKVSGNFAADRITTSGQLVSLAENDWQPERFPYNVML